MNLNIIASSIPVQSDADCVSRTILHAQLDKENRIKELIVHRQTLQMSTKRTILETGDYFLANQVDFQSKALERFQKRSDTLAKMYHPCEFFVEWPTN